MHVCAAAAADDDVDVDDELMSCVDVGRREKPRLDHQLLPARNLNKKPRRKKH